MSNVFFSLTDEAREFISKGSEVYSALIQSSNLVPIIMWSFNGKVNCKSDNEEKEIEPGYFLTFADLNKFKECVVKVDEKIGKVGFMPHSNNGEKYNIDHRGGNFVVAND